MGDSLFGSDDDSDDFPDLSLPRPPLLASSNPPPIPGLYVFPRALPLELQHQLTEDLSGKVWTGHSNQVSSFSLLSRPSFEPADLRTPQVMLFDSPTRSSLPSYLQPLLMLLANLLSPLPEPLKYLIFSQTRPRQAILNLYFPGQGITPHIDLPTRYEDGIVGISLGSSTVMDFSPVNAKSGEGKLVHSLRLRPGDVYVLSGAARWEWAHGIAYREEDWVEDEGGEAMQIRRGVRMSITLRRMREGAELLGLDGTLSSTGESG